MSLSLLHADLYSVGEIGYAVGFTDSNYFSHVFKLAVGMSPREFKKSIQGRT